MRAEGSAATASAPRAARASASWPTPLATSSTRLSGRGPGEVQGAERHRLEEELAVGADRGGKYVPHVAVQVGDAHGIHA